MEISVRDVPEMFAEVVWAVKMHGAIEETRNGEVLAMPEPFTVAVRKPNHRVLFDEDRNANPFFHVMEAIWMMAGRNDLKWIERFNSRFKEYAEADGTLHGAYGHRWRNHFERDQILEAVLRLRQDPSCRRVVLGMWDPEVDCNRKRNDLPCNTHIYFRCVKGALDMTVCNRSNDVVWGMTGANAVHMTVLHELVAYQAGLDLGTYRVVSNNAHLYTSPHGGLLRGPIIPQRVEQLEPQPLLRDDETLIDFLGDCSRFCEGRKDKMETAWMKGVAVPMYLTYVERWSPHRISCPHWRIACVQWLHWNRQ